MQNKDKVLERAAGLPFYNVSKQDFATIAYDPTSVAKNLRDYVNGFSQNVREILSQFGFDNQVTRLAEAKLLYQVVGKFAATRDLDKLSNHEMGYVFEHLIRKFAEDSNETAGEHLTPREVIELMVDLLIAPDAGTINDPGQVINILDPACGTGGMLTTASSGLCTGCDTRRLQAIRQWDPDLLACGFGVLIAFSGSLREEPSGPEFTEAQLNGFPEGQLPDRFGYVKADDPAAATRGQDEYRLLVVADKYQTGFDQPLLCGMYVDKPLTGVAAVQTLSRLNRIHPLKSVDDVRILDFVNSADDIQAAFWPWFKTTIAKPGDPNLLYDKAREVMEYQLLVASEMESFIRVLAEAGPGRLASAAEHALHAQLHSYLVPALDRFAALDTDDEREGFRSAPRAGHLRPHPGPAAGGEPRRGHVHAAGRADERRDALRPGRRRPARRHCRRERGAEHRVHEALLRQHRVPAGDQGSGAAPRVPDHHRPGARRGPGAATRRDGARDRRVRATDMTELVAGR
jgi:hypothetical protein